MPDPTIEETPCSGVEFRRDTVSHCGHEKRVCGGRCRMDLAGRGRSGGAGGGFLMGKVSRAGLHSTHRGGVLAGSRAKGTKPRKVRGGAGS